MRCCTPARTSPTWSLCRCARTTKGTSRARNRHRRSLWASRVHTTLKREMLCPVPGTFSCRDLFLGVAKRNHLSPRTRTRARAKASSSGMHISSSCFRGASITLSPHLLSQSSHLQSPKSLYPTLPATPQPPTRPRTIPHNPQ
jgi:hypothetical protein